MALEVAAARAAVSAAAEARDRDALLSVAASLPVLTAFAYERHRARAFACAIRGARDSALAELCLAAAANPPSSATFAEDSERLRALLGEVPAPAAGPTRRLAALASLGAAFDATLDRGAVRVLVSGAALVAAVSALVALPDVAFEDGPRDAAGITAPAPGAPPGIVRSDPRAAAPAAAPRSVEQPGAEPILVGFPAGESTTRAATPQTPASTPFPAASRRAPRPAPAPPPPPAPAPAPPPPPAPPAPTPEPPPAPAPAPPPATPEAPVAVVAASTPAAPAPTAPPQVVPGKGAKERGRPHVPRQPKTSEAPKDHEQQPAPGPPAPEPQTPAAPGPSDPTHGKTQVGEESRDEHRGHRKRGGSDEAP